jgi:DNA repair exonuclease SbcCD ATPase subunit
LDAQAAAETQRLKEEADRRKRGEEILAKASIGSGELKMEPIGEGKLAPFSWDKPRALEPAPAGKYDISKFTEMERLLCAAYFSKMAESAATSGDLNRAGFIGAQVNMVMQKNAQTTAIECKPPKELSTAMDVKQLGVLNQKYTKIAILYKEIMPKINQLQNIEARLGEATKTKEDAMEKIKELDKQIEAIKSRIQMAETPEKKTQEDDLLAHALALKSEAEQQQEEARESDEKLTREKQEIENELNAMKDKIQAGAQGGK